MCLPCLILPCLDLLKTVILSYILVFVFLVPPRCVHRDRRPDLNSKRRPFTILFCSFFESFLFVPVCLSRCMEVAARYPAIAHCKSAWEFGGIAVGPLAANPSSPPPSVALLSPLSAGISTQLSAAPSRPLSAGKSAPPFSAHPSPPSAAHSFVINVFFLLFFFTHNKICGSDVQPFSRF